MNNSPNNSSRRRFFRDAALGATALMASVPDLFGKGKTIDQVNTGFKLNYAPPFGMFEQLAGKNIIDQIKYIADQGFHAIFDNGLMNRPIADQEAIARETEHLKMIIGPFVAYADFSVKSFVTRDPAIREMLAGRLKTAIETSQRTNVKSALMVPGRFDESLDWDYQTNNVIENLKWCAGICEPAGLIIVIEPLNPKNHPGLFLTKMSQSFQIVRAVNNPCCKIVEDIYHQQITEGNIIPNIDACWSEIGAFHLGDTPGRKEPGTGELNYKMIFKHIASKGYKGVLCMEHGKSRSGKEGEQAVIDSYRACDNF
ncbi:MAG: TIM barrel protein [bacterium]